MARVGAYVQCWKCLHFWKYDKTKMFIADGYEKVVCPNPKCGWDNCLKQVKKSKVE